MSNWPSDEENVGMLIIGNLDGDGYLKEPPLADIADEAQVPIEFAEMVLRKLQGFVIRAAAPHRSDSVDDVFRGQSIASCQFGVARITATEKPALPQGEKPVVTVAAVEATN